MVPWPEDAGIVQLLDDRFLFACCRDAAVQGACTTCPAACLRVETWFALGAQMSETAFWSAKNEPYQAGAGLG